ncbi:MAG: hypothetical protein V1844_17925 [Pseudomonadota bacterium]
MNQLSAHSFNTLVAHYLGGQLPEEMAAAISLPALPIDVKRFITRMLVLMQKADFPATDFTPTLIWQLSNIIPGFLPCAWSGRVPPLTLPKRNAKIDAYVVKQPWPDGLANPVFVDLGCGFPPITTTEAATALSGWRVFGVDRSFFDYVVYEGNGNYACFNGQGAFQYFQPRMDAAGTRMYQNPAEDRLRFERIFDDLHPLLSKAPDQTLDQTSYQTSETVEKNGYTLVHHPIRNYEAPTVTFIESEMEDVQVPPAHAIRCMNTLFYFEPETRQRMLAHAGTLIADSGILIVGANLMNGACCRYVVYKRDNWSIEATEFALGLDNLRPISVMPWYTLHDDDPEAMLLADVIRQVRADRPFWRDFTERLDALMADYGLFQRRGNGFLYALEGEAPAADFAQRASRLWQQIEEEGFAEGAVDALNRAGYAAWINPVGDIAIRPNFCPLNLPDQE